MPINKRESLLFTFIMCFCMVLWMSIYNVALQHGAIDGEVVAAASEENRVVTNGICHVLRLVRRQPARQGFRL